MENYTLTEFLAYKRRRLSSWLDRAKSARRAGDRRRFFYCLFVTQIIRGSIVASKSAADGNYIGASHDFMHASASKY